jgi:hypothetical protein
MHREDDRSALNLWCGCSALDIAKDPRCSEDDLRAAFQEVTRSESYDRIRSLSKAAKEGPLGAVKRLVQAGAGINNGRISLPRESALWQAVHGRHKEVTKYLPGTRHQASGDGHIQDAVDTSIQSCVIAKQPP